MIIFNCSLYFKEEEEEEEEEKKEKKNTFGCFNCFKSTILVPFLSRIRMKNPSSVSSRLIPMVYSSGCFSAVLE